MTPGARLVELGPQDAGEVMVLQIAASVSQAQQHNDLWLPAFAQTAEELSKELADPQVTGLGWRNEAGRLLACVRLTRSAEVVYVGRLMVAPDLQGQGLGSSLMRASEDFMPEEVRRFDLFTGEFSPDNVRLYERLGYQQTHQEVGAHGYSLIYMSKFR